MDPHLTSDRKPTLVIADDHPLVLDSLRMLFECVPWIGRIEVCRDGEELLTRARHVSADAVITDLSMPRLDGPNCIRRLRRYNPRMAIIAISGAELWFPAPTVLEAGADAYLSKHRPSEDIVTALAEALAHHARADGRQAPAGATSAARVPAGSELSEREREVLKLLAEGLSIDESATLLHISPATVRKHREHLFEKLGTSNTAKLTRLALHMGLAAD